MYASSLFLNIEMQISVTLSSSKSSNNLTSLFLKLFYFQHYRGSYKSLNTGIITLMNYGKHVPPAVSHVTMAHEMGHNFGSPHDPETDHNCVPGGDDGNYIMFARATSGDKYNNKRFSPCSLRSIHEVLTAKARGPKGCFTGK